MRRLTLSPPCQREMLGAVVGRARSENRWFQSAGGSFRANHRPSVRFFSDTALFS